MRTLIFVANLMCISFAIAQEVTFTAPASTPAGGTFEVSWTGGAERGDRIEITNADGGMLAPRAYGYANPNRKVGLTAPPKPGSYLITYTKGNETLASIPLEVTPVTATLDAPAQVDMGQSFEVTWTGPAYKQDLIAIFDASGRRLTYNYVAMAKGGPLRLTAPDEPGDYEVRYVMHREVLASTQVNVKGVEAEVTAATKAPAGSDLDVKWAGPDNQGDRIGLARRGAEAYMVGKYAYTSQSVNNSVTLVLPEETGNYDVVYVTGDKIIGRAPMEVTEATASLMSPGEVMGKLAFEVQWEGPANRQDRVILVDPVTEQEPVDYAYTDPLEKKVTIRAPEKPGAYELRYRTGAGRVLATRPITVTPPTPDPGWLEVTRDMQQGLGEGSAVEVILDASGSMLQRQGNRRRIEIAKTTLTDLVENTLPPGVGFALRVFGHKEAGSCRTDLEVPLQSLDASAVSSKIASVNAMNLAKTPIADSLARIAADLKDVTGERIVILVTDGEETCDGDPALAIKNLRAQGWDVSINIVGYAIDDVALQQTFEGWAALGGGQYLNASDAQQLAEAVRQAVTTRFSVLDGSGSVVGRGVANSAAIELPAGSYVVRYALGGKTRETAVEVASKETAELVLP